MHRQPVVRLAACVVVCVEVAWAAAAQPQPQLQPKPRYVTAAEAASLLGLSTSLAAALPTDTPARRTEAFSAWISARDAEIRARVFRGEEDALVPLLLFGTSFTRAPRLTRAFFEEQAQRFNGPGQAEARERAFTVVFEQRLDDLLERARRRCEQRAADVGTRHDRASGREPPGSPRHRPLSSPDVCARHTGKRSPRRRISRPRSRRCRTWRTRARVRGSRPRRRHRLDGKLRRL